MSNSTEGKGYYINGRKQVIELLQFLDEDERNKLLKNMSARNAIITRELSEQSFSFKDLFHLDEDNLAKVMKITSPAIVGLALYLTPKSFQRRALTSMERASAEQAFSIMTRDLSSNRQECLKAQNKIVQNAIELSRRGLLKL